MSLDSILEEINDKFTEALNNVKKSTFIKKKAQLIASTLEQNSQELVDYIYENQNHQIGNQLSNLYSLLIELSKQISDQNIQDMLWSSLRNDTEIKRIIININTIMNDIYAALQAIGIKNPTKFETDTFSQDITNIYEFLVSASNKFQQKMKEAKQMLNQCTDNKAYLNKESPKEILDQYKDDNNYKIDRDLIDPDKKIPFYRDEQYQCFSTTYRKDNVKIPIIRMELVNNRYLGRILEVFTQLNHPYVESFIGFYNSNDDDKDPQINIITKKVGIDLFSILHNSKTQSLYKLKPKDRSILFYKIAQAMEYVHFRNVIHRNLTSSSIMICNDQDEIYPVIANFRSSRPMPKTSYDANLTNFQQCNGKSSSYFFAKEFYNGGRYNESIDVFSYGGILYELATGKVPFANHTPQEVKDLIMKGERPDINDLRQNNADLADLIENCWQDDPNKRYTFSKILKEIQDKNIIFPQDEKEKIEIENFYQKNTSSSSKIQNCKLMLDEIMKIIKNSYQFRNVLFSILPFLKNYREFFDVFNQPEDKDSKDLINNIEIKIQCLLPPISKTLFENFKTMAEKEDVFKITESIKDFMDEIDELIRKLGYSMSGSYSESLEDLIYDYHELYNFYQNFYNIESDEERKKLSDKRKLIKHYFTDTKQNEAAYKKIINISNELASKRIAKLLSKFNKLKFEDISQISLKKRSRHNDYDDCDTNFDEHANNINDDKDQGVINREKNSVLYEGRAIIKETNTQSIIENNTPLIIKIFDLGYLQSERNCINIQKEIENMTKIDPKCIEKFVGYVIDERDCDAWLIIESASDTKEKLLRSMIPKLSDEQKTTIAYNLADLFKYLISQQIDYYDITASNIIIEGENPKLLDFGDKSLNDCAYSFSKILYEMHKGEIAPTTPNFKFNKKEEDKSELEKIIELGFQTNKKRSFDDIYNTMQTYKGSLHFSSSS